MNWPRVLFLCLLGVSMSSAATYHVSPDGDDAHAGSAEQPWASLTHAAEQVRPGDRVLVHGGTYRLSETQRIACEGQPDAWIEFAAAPGETPVLDGIDMQMAPGRRRGGPDVLRLAGASYVRVIGLTVRNSHGFGIAVREPSHHIDIVDCTVDFTFAPAIGCWNVQYLRVVGNEVTRANRREMCLWGDPGRECPHEAISIAGVAHFEVAWNHVHHNGKEGIDVKEVSRHGLVHHNYVHHNPRQGLYADAWFGLLEDVTFRSNVVHDCEWGAVISVEGRDSQLRGVRIEHNLLYDNRGSGVYFGTWGTDGLRSEIVIAHNTLWGNGNAYHWAGPTGSIDLRSANARDVAVVHNLCAGGGGYEIATALDPAGDALAERNIRIAWNLIESFKSQTDSHGAYARPYPLAGEPVVVGDPKLTDPAHGDFTLRADSPAIDAGDPEGPRDADGSRADLGALPLGQNRLPDVEPYLTDFPPYQPHRLEGWPQALQPANP